MRQKRELNNTDKDYFLNLTPDDIDITLLDSLFADRYDRKTNKTIPSKYNTYDEFDLSKGEYFNTSDIRTNCGIFVLNKALFEKDLVNIVGYVNKPFSKSTIGMVEKKIVNAVKNDELSPEAYIRYMNTLCAIAYGFNTQVSTSLTLHSMTPIPEVAKAKEKLINDNRDSLKNDDVFVAIKMNDDLSKLARTYMKDDPAMELYDSGARGGFGKYAQSQIMRGPTYNANKGKFEVITDAFYDGMPKDKLPVIANDVVNGSYSKAIATGECGYVAKEFIAAYQSMKLDKKGSDCGTKMTAKVNITSTNIDYFIDMYAKLKNDSLVLITEHNSSDFIGKTVDLRVPHFCASKGKKCNMCYGDRYYKMGIENIGLLTCKIANSILNMRMKAFHDASVKISKFKIEDILQ